jgi:hypothetical protein
MRLSKKLAIVAAVVAMLMTGLGGLLDLNRGDGSITITKQHAWNDGMFLMLLAIFLALL